MSKPNLETRLATEIILNQALLRAAINLAIQLGVADGGDMTTVRAVIARIDETATTIGNPAQFGVEVERIVIEKLEIDLKIRWKIARDSLLCQSTLAVHRAHAIPPTRQ